MTHGIALREVSVDDSLKLQKVGAGLHQSGLYPQFKNAQSCYAVVQYGYELGLGPMTSLQNINLIQGKPAANGQTMLSLAMSRGVTFKVEEETTESCTILFKRGKMEYRATFTHEDAKRAGLTGKDNWKKWPTEMLYWRAVAKGVRRIAPDAVMGLYTPDELTDGSRAELHVETPQKATHAPKKDDDIQDAEYQPAPDGPEPITNAQLIKLNSIMTNQGVTDRDHKLAIINGWLEKRSMATISTGKELTKDQASILIDHLETDPADKFKITEMDEFPGTQEAVND